tara:strand:- start:3501 stop:3701 length:201 start_codon:yes stop_codon:yes gene_type:complete
MMIRLVVKFIVNLSQPTGEDIMVTTKKKKNPAPQKKEKQLPPHAEDSIMGLIASMKKLSDEIKGGE